MPMHRTESRALRRTERLAGARDTGTVRYPRSDLATGANANHRSATSILTWDAVFKTEGWNEKSLLKLDV